MCNSLIQTFTTCHPLISQFVLSVILILYRSRQQPHLDDSCVHARQHEALDTNESKRTFSHGLSGCAMNSRDARCDAASNPRASARRHRPSKPASSRRTRSARLRDPLRHPPAAMVALLPAKAALLSFCTHRLLPVWRTDISCASRITSSSASSWCKQSMLTHRFKYARLIARSRGMIKENSANFADGPVSDHFTKSPQTPY